MGSENKKGKTLDEMSVIETIRQRMRPLLERRFKTSKEAAEKAMLDGGIRPQDVEMCLAWFEQGWVSGAEDVASVNLKKVMQDRHLPKTHH